MKRTTGLLMALVAVSILTSCNKVSYRKTRGGLPYKLYKGKGGKQVVAGNFIKVNLTQHIISGGKDSVYFTSVGKLPYFVHVKADAKPYTLDEIYPLMKVGDSMVATQMIDTFIKRNPASVPQQFRNGDQIKYFVKVLEVYSSDSAAQAEDDRAKKEWLENEIKFIEKYLADKGVRTERTPSGAFVEVLDRGQGNPIDSGNYVSVNYKGTSFSGKIFDTNLDNSFQHNTPLSFTVGTGEMIRGFDEALRFLGKGGKARVYIPSMLAFGPSPTSPNIMPFEHIIFDLTVLDVAAKAPELPAQTISPGKNLDRPQ
jgi:FKBP-type peptidyl-prolyl cis-trans isomerase FkpA